MPEIFLLVHPVGTVIGNAAYGNYSIFYQNASIGSTAEGIYPQFGDSVIFYSKSSILGSSIVESNVVFGANSFILNVAIPENSVVVGQYPKHRILENNTRIIDDIFDKI